MDFLAWPFFEPRHRAWRERVAAFAANAVPALVDHDDADGSCRRLVRALGEAGLLAPTVAHSGEERLRGGSGGLADFAFAMQGLGSGPVSLFGSPEQRRRWLPDVAAGRAIAAFALTEAES